MKDQFGGMMVLLPRVVAKQAKPDTRKGKTIAGIVVDMGGSFRLVIETLSLPAG